MWKPLVTRVFMLTVGLSFVLLLHGCQTVTKLDEDTADEADPEYSWRGIQARRCRRSERST